MNAYSLLSLHPHVGVERLIGNHLKSNTKPLVYGINRPVHTLEDDTYRNMLPAAGQQG